MQIADRSCENRRSDGWEVGAVILIFFITVAYHKNDVMRQVPSPHSSKPGFGWTIFISSPVIHDSDVLF